MRSVTRIIEVAYHRNGVGGRPFYAVSFVAEGSPDKMVGIIPVAAQPGECFVLHGEQTAQGVVTFGLNSWRGDDYEAELREAIVTHSMRRHDLTREQAKAELAGTR